MKQVSSVEARRKLQLNENASWLFKRVHTRTGKLYTEERVQINLTSLIEFLKSSIKCRLQCEQCVF
jgi:hypothetical protein